MCVCTFLSCGVSRMQRSLLMRNSCRTLSSAHGKGSTPRINPASAGGNSHSTIAPSTLHAAFQNIQTFPTQSCLLCLKCPTSLIRPPGTAAQAFLILTPSYSSCLLSPSNTSYHTMTFYDTLHAIHSRCTASTLLSNSLFSVPRTRGRKAFLH